jgi:hypothetical protein
MGNAERRLHWALARRAAVRISRIVFARVRTGPQLNNAATSGHAARLRGHWRHAAAFLGRKGLERRGDDRVVNVALSV